MTLVLVGSFIAIVSSIAIPLKVIVNFVCFVVN